jgi:hypothetical protein
VKGDFSRLTFAEKNHYRRVLMQQGRVAIDADGNEQIAIDDHIAATTSNDVIGQAGYPIGTLPNGKPAGGFALGLAPGGTDVTISPGRMYVDGILVENDAAGATLLNQPNLPGMNLAGLGATKAGVYVAYLDVWERLITALDDPRIRESALGGPDTSVRSKVVWQVKLAFLEAPPAAGAALPTCTSAGTPWPAAPTGMLAAGSAPPAAGQPCILAPETGYQRLENQLYRVEIHTRGADGTATFKWSRENGSVVALIGADPAAGAPGTTVTGPTFWVSSLSPDPSLGLAAGDWVELTDDVTELADGRGTLYQVASTPTDGHHVTLSTNPPPVTLALHPKLRRWDQKGAGLGNGVPVTTGAPIGLEGGVQVTFSAGTYAAGDYWVIPARTATSIQQGYVEWPVSGGNPVPEPRRGIVHHHAKLGLVAFTPAAGGGAGGTFAGLGTATEPTDCRLPFPPLTDLTPAQSLSPCTFVVRPGPGWEQPILQYFENPPPPPPGGTAVPLDAEICFPIGTFPVTAPVVISKAGHIRVNGAGWGTRLLAAREEAGGAESLLKFVSCASVSVRDLYGEGPQAVGGRGHIGGVLAFSNCGEVSVEDVWLRCGSAVSARGAACISVSSDVSPATAPVSNVATGAGSARIRSCQLHVGEMQVGIQLVHQARARVEDNEIVVDPIVRNTTLDARLADGVYKAIARSYLISNVSLTAPPAATPTTTAKPPTTATPPPTTALPPTVSTAPPVVRAAAAETLPSTKATATPAAQPAVAAAAQPPTPAEVTPTPTEVAVTPTTPVATATPGAATTPVATTTPPAAVLRVPVQVAVGTQTLHFVAQSGLDTTWQAFLANNPPKALATQTDAIRFIKTQANQILTNPTARAGLSGFSAILNLLNRHVPLAARGIVVGGQAIGNLEISGNTISGVVMGISVGVSHHPTAAETKNEQRTPDRMGTIRIVGNTVECGANDVAAKMSRFGIFVGNANSLEVDSNRLSVTAMGIPSAPAADGIRVVGYLGHRAVIRHNHLSGFAMGVRVMPLLGNGPAAKPAPSGEVSYVQAVRPGMLWLVADNAIEGASRTPTYGPFEPTKNAPTPPLYVDAWGCLRVDNAVL